MSLEADTGFRDLRRMAERFADRELRPGFLEHENYPFAPLNDAALRTAAELGLFSLVLPEAQGGSGLGIQALCEILEPLAAVDAGFAAVVFTNSLAHSALLRWAGPERAAGMTPSALIALPIYDLPSDLPLDLAAEKHAGGYALRGKVELAALAPLAAHLLLPARIEETGGVGFFLLPADARGLKIGAPLLTLGLRTCPAADVELDAVTVPAESLLCGDAASAYPPLASLFRPAVAAMALGALKGSYEAARDYARERYQAGRMIIEHDLVRLMLTNMAVVAVTGAALVATMARAAEPEQPDPLAEAGLILLTEQASRAATDGVQILGGYGYMQEYGQEKRMRDTKQIESVFGAARAKRLELADRLLGG